MRGGVQRPGDQELDGSWACRGRLGAGVAVASEFGGKSISGHEESDRGLKERGEGDMQ